MQVEKPQITAIQERANIIYRYLRAKQDYCTKKELCFVLGWEYNTSNERRIRDILSLLSHKKPIIATSDNNKGYKLAQTQQDIEEVEHTWKELDKRIEEIENRKKPLISFRDSFKN